ncbi:hypothetical protein ACMGE6_02180 [Macrococcus equi]|uniref:hypothetical protein n=1 Tax=Macrococcus equi TaxID=3395462 RepID=UPI0039BEBE71
MKSDKNYYHKWLNGKEDLLTLGLIGKGDGLTEEAMLPASYYNWNKNIKNSIEIKDITKVDVLSDKFKDGFVDSNKNIIANHKIGENARKVYANFKSYNRMQTTYGEFNVGSYAGFKSDKSFEKVTKLMYTSPDNVTYNEWLKVYGEPDDYTFKVDKNIEHILTYNKVNTGYKVIVGFDSYKGHLKYIIKERIK